MPVAGRQCLVDAQRRRRPNGGPQQALRRRQRRDGGRLGAVCDRRRRPGHLAGARHPRQRRSRRPALTPEEAAMKPMRAWAAAAVLATAAVLLPGCGSSPTATVSGSVTYDGQPVGEGYVTFTPSDGKGRDAGGPIANGQYSVTGLSPGPKVVKVIAVKKVNFASTSAEMQRKAAVAQKAGNYDGLVD